MSSMDGVLFLGTRVLLCWFGLFGCLLGFLTLFFLEYSDFLCLRLLDLAIFFFLPLLEPLLLFVDPLLNLILSVESLSLELELDSLSGSKRSSIICPISAKDSVYSPPRRS